MTMSDSAATDAGDGGSTSTIVAEAVTGSHVLKVQGFSETNGLLGVGNCVCSGAFTVGGHKWRVMYYPDGIENSDLISMFIRFEDGNNCKAKARARFTLLNQVGKPVSSHSKITIISEFSAMCPTWGFVDYISREELESSPYLYDDSFKIKCEVTVYGDMNSKTTRHVPVVPPPELHLHLGDLLAGKVEGDVKFKVGRKTFTAHRSILASRSSVFMAELFGTTKEKKTAAATVHINDMEPRVFKAFLHFIYTDSLPEIDEGDRAMPQHLLVAADKYDMERLKLICEVMLHKYIDRETVVSTLVVAQKHGCHGLKEACLEFIASPCNLEVVMDSDDFQYLARSCPSVLKELTSIIMPVHIGVKGFEKFISIYASTICTTS